MPVQPSTAAPCFADLSLPAPLLAAVSDAGYEAPSPIQAKMIPQILAGRDVLGQAQTGTGKTAAFALPLLARLDLGLQHPQVLVLAPTRELAIQVAESFQQYAAHLPGFHVLPIYGGQDYKIQLRQLARKVHVVVGTPGRVMDHVRRGTLQLNSLTSLVLDEADEMLRMGFIDDVEWILDQTPSDRQVALFSATMPPSIRRIAQKYLHDPVEITIEERTSTAKTVHQRFLTISLAGKLDALTRIMEAEPFDGMLIFVRTKSETVELAEKLEARGFGAAALNGDIQQSQRQKTVEALKSGKLDILVATDVAARGLDVERISHVINYDIPYDTESYVHRIGRTGRAGRKGEAILLITHRETRMLRSIEKSTGQKIEPMQLPSIKLINDRRIAAFKERINATMADGELDFFASLVEEYSREHDTEPIMVAAALAKLVQGDSPLLLQEAARPAPLPSPRREKPAPPAFDEPPQQRRSKNSAPGMERYRIEVGSAHGVKPGNIVGAIANEAELDSQYIGHIDIQEEYSTVDLPAGMPPEIFALLKLVRVAGRRLDISRIEQPSGSAAVRQPRKMAPRSGKKIDRPLRPGHKAARPKTMPGRAKKTR